MKPEFMKLRAGTSWLFCPADRPDRFDKAASTADVVILDLEDGVAPHNRDAARQAIASAGRHLEPDRTVIRINAHDTPDQLADLALLAELPFTMVMLPKAAAVREITELAPLNVVVLCETVEGVLALSQMARASNCIAISWGVHDLAADLGASRTHHDDGALLHFAADVRTRVRFAAAAADVPAIDTVWINLRDGRGLDMEAVSAADMGFQGKLVIHPEQAASVRRSFTPSDDQLDWASRVLASAAEHGEGASSTDGEMIDRPIIERARSIWARGRSRTGDNH